MLKKIKYFLHKFNWLRILNSPFKLPLPSFYFGEIKHGTPYFLPRKWVKYTAKDRFLAAMEKMKQHPDNDNFKFKDWYDYYENYQKPIPRKFGFDIIPLGWKPKFDSLRHEWNPGISFVCFNKQFCIFFTYKDGMIDMCLWEAWLYYDQRTDKSKSKKERLKETFKLYSANWGNDKKGYTNYYFNILKKKYIKYITE